MAVMQILGSVGTSLLGNILGSSQSNVTTVAQRNQRYLNEIGEKTRKNLLDLEYQKLIRDAKLKEEESLLKSKIQDKTRSNILKKQIASQKAKFGASGISSSSRSVDAVLKGLKIASDEGYQNFLKLLDIEKKQADLNTEFALKQNEIAKNEIKKKEDVKSGAYRIEKLKDFVKRYIPKYN
jgi:hypothetical protein